MVSISLRQNRVAAPARNTAVSPAHLYRVSGSDPARDHTGNAHHREPASLPHREPAHLRHRPGDTWEIGGRPHDPADPGPYGAPGWYQDRRTGRHRRGELPDPLPTDRRPQPEPRHIEDGQPHHKPRRESRSGPEPYRFDRLREGAWDRFMIVSAPLAAAHSTPRPRRRTATGRDTGLAWALWNVLVWRLLGLLNGSSNRRGERRHRALARPGLREPRPATDHDRDAATVHPTLSRRPLGPAEHAERTAALARAVAGARRARAEAAGWA